MGRQRAVVIMAAGLGTRMRSKTIKVLHPVAGQPMVLYPVQSALDLGAALIVLVLGHQREAVEAAVREAFPKAPIVVVHQAEQLGTAHAVNCARDALADFDGDVFILSGDVPTLATETIQALDRVAGDAVVGVLGMQLADPASYGRLITDSTGGISAIVEARDCSPEQLSIDVVNAGVYRADARFLFKTLATLGNDNAQGEFYLTDIVAAAAEASLGARVLVLTGAEAESAEGVNDRRDLAAAEARMQDRLRGALMDGGVTFTDPSRVIVHHGVEVGADTLIEPNVMLLGSTRIGSDCVIEQGVRIADTQVGENVTIYAHSNADRAVIEAGCKVGPFARLREGSVLRQNAKIGNFVETKKTVMGVGAKASHLSYLGDAEIGAGTNIGAGTITCNYDGKNKHQTVVGDGAFIGSNTALVAPVSVGAGALVGAGSTITTDVPAGALALGRARQKNIDGWAAELWRQRKNEEN